MPTRRASAAQMFPITLLPDRRGALLRIEEELAHLADVVELNCRPASEGREDGGGREQLESVPGVRKSGPHGFREKIWTWDAVYGRSGLGVRWRGRLARSPRRCRRAQVRGYESWDRRRRRREEGDVSRREQGGE